MKTEQLYYCKRCGRTAWKYTDGEKKCGFCRNTMQLVPAEYVDEKCDMLIPEREQEFMDKYIKSSPEYDPELHEKMKHWLDTRWDDEPSNKPGNPYGIECPYCHSTDIQRIYGVTLTEFTNVSAVGKQFQCRFCSAYF